MNLLQKVVSLCVLGLWAVANGGNCWASDPQRVEGVARLPQVAATKRLVQAITSAGSPLNANTIAALDKVDHLKTDDDVEVSELPS